MKFYLLLFILSQKLKRAAGNNPGFKKFIRKKELSVVIRTSLGMSGRKFIFSNGRLSSCTSIQDCDAAMVWCDGDTAFRAMASGDDEAIVASLTEKKLTIEGNFKEFMWFARALDLMAGKA